MRHAVKAAGAVIEVRVAVKAVAITPSSTAGSRCAMSCASAQITIGAETASVTLSSTGNSRAADRYEFNRRSGEITPATMYADAVPADRLRGWIYSIHTGSLGGLITRILWLLGALLGASLPLTGYYIDALSRCFPYFPFLEGQVLSLDRKGK